MSGPYSPHYLKIAFRNVAMRRRVGSVQWFIFSVNTEQSQNRTEAVSGVSSYMKGKTRGLLQNELLHYLIKGSEVDARQQVIYFIVIW